MEFDESDDEWSDVSEESAEINDDSNSFLCLFCQHVTVTIEQCFLHVSESHGFSLYNFIKENISDFYSYIKYVNYIRKHNVPSQSAAKLEKVAYSSDDYLMPVVADDGLLQFDIDSFLEQNLSTEDNEDLHSKLLVAENRAITAESSLQNALTDLNECKKKLQELLLGSSSITPNCVKSPRSVNDESEAYFSSYAHYGIHEEMLKDSVRTLSYQKFVNENSVMFKNATVLDIGCGTSILSMFAATAGAKSVVGVDNSDIAYNAIDIVKENKLDHVIKIMKCRAEDLKLDEKVDIIISEWMGYFLIFESMLDTIIYCRDNYLKDGGCVYPDKCSIMLIGLQDNCLINDKLKYWEDVYGFKMNCMRSKVLKEPLIQVTSVNKIITKSYDVISFDLMTMTTEELDLDKKFILEAEISGELNAIAGYFDIGFQRNLSTPINFSTSPFDTPTHWKQTVFILEKSFHVEIGDLINGRIICKKNKQDKRALDIAIIIYDDTYKNVRMKQYFVLC